MRHLSAITPVLLVASASIASAAVASYDFNSGNGGFTASGTVGMASPFAHSVAGGVGNSGAWSTDGQAADLGINATTTITSPALIVESNGFVVLGFDHMFSFEGGNWDGGAVFVSVNGGSFTYLPNGAFTANGYTGTVTNWGPAAGQSDLADQLAWVVDSPGRAAGDFITSTANLGPFNAGDSIRVQFMAASDTNTTGTFVPQWVIDNVSLTNVVPEPGSALLGFAALGLAFRRRR